LSSTRTPRRLASRGAPFGSAEGDLDGAIEDFEHVLKLNPEHPTLYTNLANAYASFKRFREAREAYDQAIRISPNDPNPWCRRGFLSILEKDNEAAERDLSKALALEPKHTLSLANRGLLRASLGQRAEAIPDLIECLRCEPDPRTTQQVKQALVRLGVSPP
jgi:Flp pilus assembly protein TadD